MNSDALDWLFGMTTPEEQAFCREYLRGRYEGVGAVVDLGCWLGASTIAMAQGLAASMSPAARERRVQAYDAFVWLDWMDPIAHGSPLQTRFRTGESFLPEFERRIAPWSSWIDVHVGDLTCTAWTGGPIEFLFVDAMKDWGLTASIAGSFFPALVPGLAVVVQQDFAFPWCPWIHLLMFRLREYFGEAYGLERSPGAVFHLTRELPRDVVEGAVSDAPPQRTEVDAAFDYADALVRGEARVKIQAAKIVCLSYYGFLDAARVELEHAELEPAFQVDPERPGVAAYYSARLVSS